MNVLGIRLWTNEKGKNKKGKYGKKGNQDQQSTDNNNAEKNNSSVPSTPTTPQTASALSAALFGTSSTPEPEDEYVRPETPEPEPVKAPMGKWAKKPEIKDTILKDDFVLPKAYRKEEPKRARKKKYRNINEHSDVILLPGRHMCDCQVSYRESTPEFLFRFFYADSSIFSVSGACSFSNDPQNDFSSSWSRSEGTFEFAREFIIFSTTFSLAE